MLSPEMTSFENIFQFRIKERVTGTEVKRIGWGTTGMPSEVKILLRGRQSDMGHCGDGEHPFVCNVWCHANELSSEPFKGFFIKHLIDSLPKRNKCFVGDFSFVTKKKNQH
ncbi:hypothetical protein TNCT_717391 [Trichonephila clavata]|uniref:Uncharacterized protein n=1 Tax=Trichonephila clavata TaxID=2740835 RepID=A0A8X6L301_TRICU|nr:hypothetical protein TNCT_717391 [Trichonephila clavata]